MRALNGDFPFPAEVPLGAILRVGGYHRHEKGAGADLSANLGIPGVAAAQFVLIEPHLHTEAPQRIGQAPGGLRVLSRVTKKYGAWSVCFVRHE